eukprot:TRINITY_DN1469_c0_g1_i1.p1 TRINITY_DN1469_c0_g1~~TRINITY_DN1469_c0_g1_i1.p1  ORF type:complete len:149 (+),score=22.64 TRINITY_DN1469_c0_g1_i1:542-988(+)
MRMLLRMESQIPASSDEATGASMLHQVRQAPNLQISVQCARGQQRARDIRSKTAHIVLVCAPECADAAALRQVPHPNALVAAATDQVNFIKPEQGADAAGVPREFCNKLAASDVPDLPAQTSEETQVAFGRHIDGPVSATRGKPAVAR